MDLSGFADSHPKNPECREIRPSSIGGKPEKPLVKIEIVDKTGCVLVNLYPMVVDRRRLSAYFDPPCFDMRARRLRRHKGESEQTCRALSPSRTFLTKLLMPFTDATRLRMLF